LATLALLLTLGHQQWLVGNNGNGRCCDFSQRPDYAVSSAAGLAICLSYRVSLLATVA
jgi:hypothetical protein